jgi:hypothetical protein
MDKHKLIHTAIGLLMLFAAAYVISIAWKAGQKGFSWAGESGYKKAGCGTRGGVECCRPNRWRWNEQKHDFECSGGDSGN